LHSRQTFGTFSLRRNENIDPKDKASLKDAFEVAQAYAQKPEGWLVFLGPYGCGKTHLAAAIGNYRKGMGDTPVFVVVPDLLDHLRVHVQPFKQYFLR